jgi:transcription elongation factor GreA
MNAKQTLVTKEGLLKLQDELEYLKTTKRREIAATIKVALSFGDLSENSEYDEAKNEQGSVEKRISEIEALLKNVRVIHEHDIKTDTVGVGSKVKVYDNAYEEEVEYNIVGSTEADPLKYKISDESPIGRALMGAKEGAEVRVDTPGGEVMLKVISISK